MKKSNVREMIDWKKLVYFQHILRLSVGNSRLLLVGCTICPVEYCYILPEIKIVYTYIIQNLRRKRDRQEVERFSSSLSLRYRIEIGI